jgi:hypothetical protein
MIRVYIFVFVSLLGMGLSQAKPPYAAMGAGASSCAKFAQDYQKDPSNFEMFYFSWAQGWMSGFNIVGNVRDLNSIELDAQERYIRIFCNEHPLDNYQSVVIALYFRFSHVDPDKKE